MLNLQMVSLRMKIVYIIEDFPIGGGIERIVSKKANIIASEYGHEVTIISVYEDHRPLKYALSEGIKVLYLNVPMASKGNALTTTLSRISTIVTAAKRLNRAIRTINPDIIFFTTTLGALLLPLCKTKARKIFESHSAKKFTPYNKFFYFVERDADCIVCLTESDAVTFSNAKRVKVISNFISSPSEYVKNYSRKAAIAVGRLEYVKGFDILIDIWNGIAREHPEWVLHIYGEGPLRDELQRQIDRSGLKDNVILCGRCEDMMNRYTEYSLHLMTSRYEGQPMTLIEAQACGLPSVVFNFEYGAKDIVKDGINGLLVSQGDRDSFSKALSRMMNDTAIRKEYGENARQMALRYSKESIMPEWLALIEELR